MRVFRLAGEITCEGVGLHTGELTKLRFLPSRRHGIFFRAGDSLIPATLDQVMATNRGVSLGNGKGGIKTVEHLLAALRWLGIRDLQVFFEGEEIPILDGSALPWIELLQSHLEETEEEFPALEISRPITLQEGDSAIAAAPAERFSIQYSIEYPSTPVGTQVWVGEITPERFHQELAPSRTFGFVDEVETLRNRGLGRGGNLENCVVMSRDAFLTPLRFRDEAVRHKVLDLLGDLALLSCVPRVRIEARKAGHRLHIEMAKALKKLGRLG